MVNLYCNESFSWISIMTPFVTGGKIIVSAAEETINKNRDQIRIKQCTCWWCPRHQQEQWKSGPHVNTHVEFTSLNGLNCYIRSYKGEYLLGDNTPLKSNALPRISSFTGVCMSRGLARCRPFCFGDFGGSRHARFVVSKASIVCLWKSSQPPLKLRNWWAIVYHHLLCWCNYLSTP